MKHRELPKRNQDILKRYLAGESIESLASTYDLNESYILLLLRSRTFVPRKHKDLTGKRRGRLTFRRRAGRMERGTSLWFCDCDCGRTVILPASTHKLSCGCLVEEKGARLTRQKRNAKIVDLYASGKYTLETLGERYGITRQRVQQIIANFKPPKDIRRAPGPKPARRKRRHP